VCDQRTGTKRREKKSNKSGKAEKEKKKSRASRAVNENSGKSFLLIELLVGKVWLIGEARADNLSLKRIEK
jgi:hypothetical protein